MADALIGKVAVVTGSSRGIGRGIALKLAAQGVRVAINYRENAAAAKDTLAHVRECGSDGFIVQAEQSRNQDLTSATSLAERADLLAKDLLERLR